MSTGDGQIATSVALGSVQDIALGRDGSLYLADASSQLVRRVTPDGLITTVAGSGGESGSDGGFSGDDGPATRARLHAPTAVAVDMAGRVYISDSANGRVRRVDLNGVISTVAGRESVARASDSLPAVFGLEIHTVAPSEVGDGRPATDRRLAFPRGLALAGDGALYIADPAAHRVRRVDPAGTISTVAGTGVRGFSGDSGPASRAKLDSPWAVAVDDAGSVFIADRGNSRVRKVDRAGTITTIALGVSSSSDENPTTGLSAPSGLALGREGDLYFSEYGEERIRRMAHDGVVTTVRPTNGRLIGPLGLAVDRDGRLFVADQRSNRIRQIDPAGVMTTVAGGG